MQNQSLKLITYEWKFKKFTSQDRLQSLFLVNAIKREIVGTKEDNGHIYGHFYKFSTLDGNHIATFYKDNSFGFGTQATGVELKEAQTI